MKDLLKESRDILQSLMISMLDHTDCTEGSEIDDMTSSAQKIINKIDERLYPFSDNQLVNSIYRFINESDFGEIFKEGTLIKVVKGDNRLTVLPYGLVRLNGVSLNDHFSEDDLRGVTESAKFRYECVFNRHKQETINRFISDMNPKEVWSEWRPEPKSPYDSIV